MRGLMPLRDAQQERPAAWCGECLGEIYPGETVYRWEGKAVCPDCFKWAVRALLETSPGRLADELGVERQVLD